MPGFIPKIVYGSGPTTLYLTQPQKVWIPKARPFGGSDVSDAGVLEAFIIRRDQLCTVTLRFLESEWADIDTWLADAQAAGSFDFYFDASDATSKYTCYLDSPKPGDGEISPTRDTFTRVLSIELTLRTTDQTRFAFVVQPEAS